MAETANNRSPPKLRRYAPSAFYESSWWRFSRDRHRRYLASLPELPNERQLLAIEMLVENEWSMRRAEHDAENALNDRYRFNSQKLAADMRKQCLLWARELNAATAARNDTAREETQPNLADVLSGIARRRTETADDGDEAA